MKQITVVSGKGGTGKTSITSALACVIKNKVIIDCDVDAANMYLVLTPKNIVEESYPGGRKAEIDYELCTNCGICMDLCRFDAIEYVDDKYKIIENSCDGCDLCMRACPVGAIKMKQGFSSTWFIAETRAGTMVHAKLGIGEDLSGKLVSLLREKAKEIAEKEKNDFILLDGPPGIGCPVIASVTGIDIAIIVTEPTQSGIHDLKRVVELTNNFKVENLVVINKFDLNLEMTKELEKHCKENNLEIIAKVPYDKIFVDSMVEAKTVVDYAPDSEITKIIREIGKRITSD